MLLCAHAVAHRHTPRLVHPCSASHSHRHIARLNRLNPQTHRTLPTSSQSPNNHHGHHILHPRSIKRSCTIHRGERECTAALPNPKPHPHICPLPHTHVGMQKTRTVCKCVKHCQGVCRPVLGPPPNTPADPAFLLVNRHILVSTRTRPLCVNTQCIPWLQSLCQHTQCLTNIFTLSTHTHARIHAGPGPIHLPMSLSPTQPPKASQGARGAGRVPPSHASHGQMHHMSHASHATCITCPTWVTCHMHPHAYRSLRANHLLHKTTQINGQAHSTIPRDKDILSHAAAAAHRDAARAVATRVFKLSSLLPAKLQQRNTARSNSWQPVPQLPQTRVNSQDDHITHMKSYYRQPHAALSQITLSSSAGTAGN
jgi:hypothetical protein